MDAVLFCRVCGSFREITNSGGGIVTCQLCYDKVHITELSAKIRNKAEIISIERSELLYTLYGRTAPKEPSKQTAIIEEECPKCGNNQLAYHTAQLRGIDEACRTKKPYPSDKHRIGDSPRCSLIRCSC